MKLGRNDPCHCGSGRKYKHCHYEADRAAEAEELRQAAEESQAADGDEVASDDKEPKGNAGSRKPHQKPLIRDSARGERARGGPTAGGTPRASRGGRRGT